MNVLRSLAFNAVFFAWTGLCCVALVWLLALPRRAMMPVVRWYLGTVGALERSLLRLDYRVLGRDQLPDGPYIVAAKHQSAWETMKLHALFHDPAVVLKRELMRIPLWGWFAAKAGLIPIDRGAGRSAINGMIAKARQMSAGSRPIVIFPQGTRVAPGARRPYKIGTFALYDALGLPVVPMALNSGLFWGRVRFVKHPGTITVQFLPPIPPGLDREAFMGRLEASLEAATDALCAAPAGPAGAPAPVAGDSATPSTPAGDRLDDTA